MCFLLNSLVDENQILVGPYINSLNEITFNEENSPKLAILDLSLDFLQKRKKIGLRKRSNELKQLEEHLNIIDDGEIHLFLEGIKILASKILSTLDTKGFFAIKLNGTIKHHVKVIIDEIFGIEKFVNEIIINSPFTITSSSFNNVIERTEYILLYSKVKNPIVKPVYNNKSSGGYWHSFVSKGQGTPKNFLINDQIIRLKPPVGTHWKLRQERILELCKEGKIRLNKNGNPEYWVPKKIGQIIDSNWLDIPLNYNNNTKYFSYSGVFERLFNLLISPYDIVLIINSRDSLALVKATDMNMKWICVSPDANSLKEIATTLDKYNIRTINSFLQKSKVEIGISPPKKNEEPIFSSDTRNSFSKFSLVHKSTYLSKKEDSLWSNELIQGDCINVLPLLQDSHRKSLKLIYIDPPFFTGIDEIMHIPVSSKEKTDAASRITNSIDSIVYKNVLQSETAIEEFKYWFKSRLTLMKPLLRLDGFIFVRFDYHFGHYAKSILDEVFKPENYVVEFLVRRMKKNLSKKQLNQQTHLIVHNDSLFVYRASEEATLNLSTVKKKKRNSQDLAEWEYSNDNIWLDIAGYQKTKKTLYPTENSESLLRRVIKVATSPKDIVGDFFAGSGTTLAVAGILGRRWIGVDIGNQSIHETRKRILQYPEGMPFNHLTLKGEGINQNLEKRTNFAQSMEIGILTEKEKKLLTISLKDSVYNGKISEMKEVYSYMDLIDYWEVDWDYNDSTANICWYSKRLIKRKMVLRSVDSYTKHVYNSPGAYKIFVNIVDIFGNCAQSIFKIQI